MTTPVLPSAEREPADYGNWIRTRILGGFAVATVLLTAVAIAAAVSGWHRLIVVVALSLGAGTAGVAGLLAYLHRQFSDRGRGIQRELWTLVVDRLAWDGNGVAVDIGTGNGALAIQLAERFPQARVIGIDLWPSSWEYSRATCEENARRRGVADRVEFRQASAAALPLADGEVDAAISHFVFHEVGDVGQARDAVEEALRVVRDGGVFAFQDMFGDERVYGPESELLAAVRGWGATEVELVALSDLIPVPRPMRGRKVLGPVALLTGRRTG
jgi:SAM-dependent methyltransferase